MNGQRYCVFDVESIGLYGEGFAAAFVVVDYFGNEMDQGYFGCDPDQATGDLHQPTGDSADREWVAANVVPGLPPHRYAQPSDVRYAFWKAMAHWKAQGALMFADCAAPVEAKFLADRYNDVFPPTPFDGPYPLHDVATVLLCAGLDPLATYERLLNELPVHNPLCDARQSARLLVQALGMIKPREITESQKRIEDQKRKEKPELSVFGLTAQAMRDLRNSIEHFLGRKGWTVSQVTALYDGEPSVYWIWTHPEHKNAHRSDQGWSMDAALALEGKDHAE